MAARASAQEPPVDDDVEVEVPAAPPADVPAPPEASSPTTPTEQQPPPAAAAPEVPKTGAPETPPAQSFGAASTPSNASTTPPSSAPARDAKPGDKGDVSLAAQAGAPQTTAPVADTNEPRSLVAEGSNYVRPLRRGLSWWGFVQAQYLRNQLSEDQLAPFGAPLNQDQFALRRARLRIDHGWEYAAATFELDGSTLSGLRVGVRRAEASLLYRGTDDDKITPLVVMTAGITDLPFGAEIGESQRDRLFMERSIGSLALFPTEADIGVKVWGAYRFLNYAVAVVNGQPLNELAFESDPNSAKDVAGRIGARANLLETLGVEGGVSFYTGTGFSPGRDATKDTVSWVDDNNNGFAEPHEILGVTGSSPVPSKNFDRWALGLDASVSLTSILGVTRVSGEAIVASNMDRGLIEADPVLSGASIRETSFSLSLVQQVSDYGVVGFRAAYYDPNSDLLEERAGTFHLRDQTFWVFSPTAGLTLPNGRFVAQYDFVTDHMGRDERGVPTDAENDQFTIRLQVDL